MHRPNRTLWTKLKNTSSITKLSLPFTCRTPFRQTRLSRSNTRTRASAAADHRRIHRPLDRWRCHFRFGVIDSTILVGALACHFRSVSYCHVSSPRMLGDWAVFLLELLITVANYLDSTKHFCRTFGSIINCNSLICIVLPFDTRCYVKWSAQMKLMWVRTQPIFFFF